MPPSVADYSSHDRQIWEEELDAFVPQRVFDAHTHMFHPEHMFVSTGSNDPNRRPQSTWSHVDFNDLKRWASILYPGRETHFVVLGTPAIGMDVDAHNHWCLSQLQTDPLSRFHRLVTPACSTSDIERDIRRSGCQGLKPYRFYSVTGDIAQCRIHEFLTHEQLELANEHGLWITMHLSRFHGCADTENLKDLQEYTERRYPKIRWILAHCARSFTYWPIRQAIDRLRDMPNIWYDVSAVTDVRPFITLFTRENPKRILYGSDGVDATYFHGQYAALGRAWQYFEPERMQLQFPHCDGRPILAIYEQLLSMKHAAEIAQWSTQDIEDLFWWNAVKAFQLPVTKVESTNYFTDKVIEKIPSGAHTQRLYERARQIIPGGTQLLSKRAEMFAPGAWPAYAQQARGCEIVDLDGRRLIDMTTSGIGACLLGYADPDVTTAVCQRIARGSMSSLNAAEEVELAERLIALHPWAEQVRYARTGGEAMSIAVRLARAATGRDKIAFCGYHGWSDWYLAANIAEPFSERHPSSNSGDPLQHHLLPGLEPAGVPQGLGGSTLPFRYNQLDELEKHFHDCGDQIAAVVMEPTRSQSPAHGFLEGVKDLCHQRGALLVLDEISSGWRMHLGGVHLKYGVHPDVAVFAKAIGNGHPMAAIIGRRSVMDAAQHSFISSTYWTEAVGPTAALATISKLQRVDIATHTQAIGDQLRQGWQRLGHECGVAAHASGHSALLHLHFDHPDALALMTLFTTRMIDHGYLAGSGFYPSLAHTAQHVSDYLAAAQTVFHELAEAIERNDCRERLTKSGVQVKHSGFKRLT